jgi:hypothetical protein
VVAPSCGGLAERQVLGWRRWYIMRWKFIPAKDRTEQAMSQDLIFELNDVRITPYIAQFGGTSYQIASIGSVRVVLVKKLNPVSIIVVLLGVGLFLAAIVRSGSQSWQNLPFLWQ